MEFPKEGWNFGSVIQGAKKKQTMELRNFGTKPLIIGFAKVTCGCLKIELKTKTVAPGESAELVVYLDTTAQVGRIKKFVIIKTNSTFESQVFIPVFGEIKPVYRKESLNLEIGAVTRKQNAVKEMKIFALKGIVPIVDSISHRSDRIAIESRHFGDKDGEHGLIVTVRIKEGARPGKLAVPIRINLKDDKIDAIRFSVMGEILGDIRLTPSDLNLPVTQKDKTAETTIKAKSASGKKFKILKATCHDPRVKIDPVSKEAKSHHEVKVTCDPGGRANNIQTRIYLTTDQPDQRIFTVNLRIRVTK